MEMTLDEYIINLKEQSQKLKDNVASKHGNNLTTIFRYVYGIGDDVKLDADLMKAASEIDSIVKLLEELKELRIPESENDNEQEKT